MLRAGGVEAERLLPLLHQRPAAGGAGLLQEGVEGEEVASVVLALVVGPALPAPLFQNPAPALGAGVARGGPVVPGVVALGVAGAGDEGAVAALLPEEGAAALGAGLPDGLRLPPFQGLGVGALRVARAPQELAVAAHLELQGPAAPGAGLLGHLGELPQKGLVELPDHLGPGDAPLLHLVQPLLHPGGELVGHHLGEPFPQVGGDLAAQGGGEKGPPFSGHVPPLFQGLEGRGVGGRAADPQLLHGLHQAGVGVAGRGLGEAPLLQDLLKPGGNPLGHRGDGGLLLLLGVPPPGPEVPLKAQHRARGAEGVAALEVGQGDRRLLVEGVPHLARQEAAPDELVEAVLLLGQVGADAFRGPFGVGGADGLVGVLDPFPAVLIGPRGLRQVLRAEGLPDHLPGRRHRLGGHPHRVRAHVGDEAHGPLRQVHPLVEALGDAHGAGGGVAQAARGGLLEGGGGEGGRGGLAPLPHLHLGHPVAPLPQGLGQGMGLGLRGEVEPALLLPLPRPEALPLHLVERGHQGGLPALHGEDAPEDPVLLGPEGLNGLLPLHHEPQGHALHPAGREGPLAELQGEEGGEVVPEEAVQDAPGLLGVHQVLVNGPRGLHRLADHPGGDLVELHPEGLLGVPPQEAGHVPADGLSLPVGVGGDEQALALRRPLQLLHHGLLVLLHLVGGGEVPLHVHPQAPLGEVHHVP